MRFGQAAQVRVRGRAAAPSPSNRLKIPVTGFLRRAHYRSASRYAIFTQKIPNTLRSIPHTGSHLSHTHCASAMSIVGQPIQSATQRLGFLASKPVRRRRSDAHVSRDGTSFMPAPRAAFSRGVVDMAKRLRYISTLSLLRTLSRWGFGRQIPHISREGDEVQARRARAVFFIGSLDLGQTVWAFCTLLYCGHGLDGGVLVTLPSLVRTRGTFVPELCGNAHRTEPSKSSVLAHDRKSDA